VDLVDGVAAVVRSTVERMSVSFAESALKRARADLERARKKQADEDKKCAAAEKAATAKRRSASSTSSESMKRSYMRDAERKDEEANKARSAAAVASSKVADCQTKVHKAETDLEKARAAEQKKKADKAERERKKREDDERRQREQAARAAKQSERERQRSDSMRDARLGDLGSGLSLVRDDVAATRAVIDARPWEHVPKRITVLVLTAEPDGEDRLRIDRELREIQEQVRSSELRDSIVFEHRYAVRFGDLIQHLNETEPDVIHFSGHGSRGGIALHADDDTTKELTNEQLDAVLGVSPNPLKLVVFNSCNSAEQAQVAVRHAAAAIGMDEPIGDEAARVFAGQLYNSLGFGRSLGLALRQAKLYVAMQLDRKSGEPTLALAEGVDADELIVVDPA
jgi:hypothetical protein